MYLEHANITVTNLDEAIRFFKTAFPHFEVRGGGNDPREWLHFGDETTYVAINLATQISEKTERNYDKIGVNHLGFVVENIEEIAKNLLKNGFKRDYPKEIEEFRIRDYFVDSDGNQFEFIQYLSDQSAERNKY